MPVVCIIQHMECETPGTITEVLDRAEIETRTIHVYLGEAIVSSLEGIDGLIVMGGAMGVYDADKYPFLNDEIALIRKSVSLKLPVLGICLGAQLIAAALGGEVQAGKEKEIGWHPVFLTDEGLLDPIFGTIGRGFTGLENTFAAFSWHGDYFTLPPGTVRLAYSELSQCQAIRYGSNVYGLQFHPEVTVDIVRDWVVQFGAELVETGIDGRSVIDGTTDNIVSLHTLATDLVDGWIRLVHEYNSTVQRSMTEGRNG